MGSRWDGDGDGDRDSVGIPNKRSCTVGKLSGLGLVLESCVNSISSRRYMNLTVHNRCLFFQDTKLNSCAEARC